MATIAEGRDLDRAEFMLAQEIDQWVDSQNRNVSTTGVRGLSQVAIKAYELLVDEIEFYECNGIDITTETEDVLRIVVANSFGRCMQLLGIEYGARELKG